MGAVDQAIGASTPLSIGRDAFRIRPAASGELQVSGLVTLPWYMGKGIARHQGERK